MYFCLSFTHKNTALGLRERLALDDGRKAQLGKLILASSKIDECVLLSTCNRTEILCALDAASASETDAAAVCASVREYLLKCLGLICKIDYELIASSADHYEGSGFIHHLFTVASSLDSLVIGETQITGQLRSALAEAVAKAPCERLQIAFSAAFKCAAAVRNQTDICKKRLSISSVAVEHAAARLGGDLTRARALIIGSGEMARLCAKACASAGCWQIDITSRNAANAAALAAEISGEAGGDGETGGETGGEFGDSAGESGGEFGDEFGGKSADGASSPDASGFSKRSEELAATAAEGAGADGADLATKGAGAELAGARPASLSGRPSFSDASGGVSHAANDNAVNHCAAACESAAKSAAKSITAATELAFTEADGSFAHATAGNESVDGASSPDASGFYKRSEELAAAEVKSPDSAKLVFATLSRVEFAGCEETKFGASQTSRVDRTRSSSSAIFPKLPRNRPRERAKTQNFSDLAEFINHYDLIFTATAAPGAIVHAQMFDASPRLVYDIAVPKDCDFERACATEVISVDDLQQIVHENLALKEEQAKIAYTIINARVREFFAREQEMLAVPAIKAMRGRAALCCSEQLAIAVRKGYLPGFSPEQIARTKRFCEQFIQAYLHEPTVRLKRAEGYELDVLEYIFAPKEDDEI